MASDFSVRLQYLTPKRALTVFGGVVASARAGWVTQAIIRRFVRRYDVNMSEAAASRLESFATFNEFFTRALREGVRPLADAAWLCPVDGAISQFGRIEGDQVFQAKGHNYSSLALLGGDPALATQFENGHFATLYLSPRDYHRIHMPCDATLVRMIHVPGDLFSVNPATAQGVPGLFARNERVICQFESAQGPFAMVLVGATIVGSIATVWHGVVTPPRSDEPREWRYEPGEVRLARGAEMGRFMLGSTVVMLFGADAIAFNPQWAPVGSIRVGEAMGGLPGATSIETLDTSSGNTEPDAASGSVAGSD